MEEKRGSIPPSDETLAGHNEITSLFEQRTLLVIQAYNSLAYQ